MVEIFVRKKRAPSIFASCIIVLDFIIGFAPEFQDLTNIYIIAAHIFTNSHTNDIIKSVSFKIIVSSGEMSC